MLLNIFLIFSKILNLSSFVSFDASKNSQLLFQFSATYVWWIVLLIYIMVFFSIMLIIAGIVSYLIFQIVLTVIHEYLSYLRNYCFTHQIFLEIMFLKKQKNYRNKKKIKNFLFLCFIYNKIKTFTNNNIFITISYKQFYSIITGYHLALTWLTLGLKKILIFQEHVLVKLSLVIDCIKFFSFIFKSFLFSFFKKNAVLFFNFLLIITQSTFFNNINIKNKFIINFKQILFKNNMYQYFICGFSDYFDNKGFFSGVNAKGAKFYYEPQDFIDQDIISNVKRQYNSSIYITMSWSLISLREYLFNLENELYVLIREDDCLVNIPESKEIIVESVDVFSKKLTFIRFLINKLFTYYCKYFKKYINRFALRGFKVFSSLSDAMGLNGIRPDSPVLFQKYCQLIEEIACLRYIIWIRETTPGYDNFVVDFIEHEREFSLPSNSIFFLLKEFYKNYKYIKSQVQLLTVPLKGTWNKSFSLYFYNLSVIKVLKKDLEKVYKEKVPYAIEDYLSVETKLFSELFINTDVILIKNLIKSFRRFFFIKVMLRNRLKF